MKDKKSLNRWGMRNFTDEEIEGVINSREYDINTVSIAVWMLGKRRDNKKLAMKEAIRQYCAPAK